MRSGSRCACVRIVCVRRSLCSWRQPLRVHRSVAKDEIDADARANRLLSALRAAVVGGCVQAQRRVSISGHVGAAAGGLAAG